MRRWLPPLAVLLLAAGVRFYRIDAQSLWYDEGISAFQLTRSFGDILYAASQDTHPPLYYWTLKAWSLVFGSSELSLRGLSAVWGVAAVGLTYLTGRGLFGTVAATIAAVLVAVSPLSVYYSQEVRMYSQVTALGLLAAYCYVRRSYWAYAAAAILTLYSQYLGIAMLAALNFHALITMRKRSEWLQWLSANAVAALAFLPWLPTFIAQQSHALNTHPRTAGELLFGTLNAYGGGFASGELLLWTGVALVALAAFGVALGPNRANSVLALLLWLLPLGLVLALGIRSGLFEVRYLVLGIPGLMLLAAVGIVALTRQPVLASVAAAALVIPAGMALQQQYFDPRLARDDYRGLVQAISAEARPGDAVILSAPNQTEIFSYYYKGPLPEIGLPAQRPIDPADTVARLEGIRQEYDRVWLVSWAMNEADPRGVIPNWLASNGFKATHQWYGSVQLSLVGFADESASVQPLDVSLDNGIVLEGYRLPLRTLHAGETLPLTLVWRASQSPAGRWKVFTHLLDGLPQVVAQRDAEPADNLRPTTSWTAGERIEDNYGILVPDALPAGSYTLEIGMYNGDQRATFLGHGDHLVLGTVQVTP